MDDLATMTTRQEESTKKQSGNAPQDMSRTSCPRRHVDGRPGFRKRREPSPRAPRIAEVEDALPPAELPPEAPKPDASESAIKQFILDNSVCFYHARGRLCPSIFTQGCRPYSHAQQPVLWGAYARIQQKSSSAQTQHDVRALEEEVLIIAMEPVSYTHLTLPTTSRV